MKTNLAVCPVTPNPLTTMRIPYPLSSSKHGKKNGLRHLECTGAFLSTKIIRGMELIPSSSERKIIPLKVNVFPTSS
jgi:hypothetical protein